MTKPKTHHDFNPVGFGLAPMKREGDVQDPDALTWECGDPTKCDHCQDFYAEWKRRYIEQEKQSAHRAWYTIDEVNKKWGGA